MRNKHHIPVTLDIAAAWSWRLIVVLLSLGLIGWILSKITILWLPLVVAVFYAGLLRPVVAFLTKKGLSRPIASTIVFIGSVVGFTWIMAAVIEQLVSGFGSIWAQTLIASVTLQGYVDSLPIALPEVDLQQTLSELVKALQNNLSSLAKSFASLSYGAGTFISIVVISLFATFFFLLQGKDIWEYLVGMLPKGAQGAIKAGAKKGWVGVEAYVRFQVLIAVLEGIWIGTFGVILGLPLALPLGLLVMVGAIIPILGGAITGLLAVLIAFGTGGWVSAMVMAIAVLVINQLETIVLQPWLMGRAVKLHALVILLSVVGGASIAGIVGALVTVPLVAFLVGLTVGVKEYLRSVDDISLKTQL